MAFSKLFFFIQLNGPPMRRSFLFAQLLFLGRSRSRSSHTDMYLLGLLPVSSLIGSNAVDLNKAYARLKSLVLVAIVSGISLTEDALCGTCLSWLRWRGEGLD